ncbi:hypothetical protein HPL003_18735 [Paenibacillus terrae HPL-003]|uniref:Uncharacterized protein n=1 Tax=Paenibacillus terrae (strain HPL-003) TaxID=985665 RepID=G7W4T9_PAETH|nr:hypothetical protein [Paenibacillus terrae]AET60489.1 hypothetical protein HPL003_18735 [Paenibacillus terrae HPL-003]
MQKMYRNKRVEGTRIPGIIHNGSYFLTPIDVYEDGMVNCWDLVDLAGLIGKLESGWIVTDIPEGEHLSIFHLGYFKVTDAHWQFDAQAYYEYIVKVIKQLNPDFTNIYQVHEREKALMEKRRLALSPSPTPFYVARELGYNTNKGNGFYIFCHDGERNHLVDLTVYEDGKVFWTHSGEQHSAMIEDIKVLFENGTFFVDCTEGARIYLSDFAEVTLTGQSELCIQNKYDELIDMHIKLQGGKTASEKCEDAYHAYLIYPSDYTRERLKEAYEQVPEHLRMYLGDMDNRDTDYIRIIYHPDEKREV